MNKITRLIFASVLSVAITYTSTPSVETSLAPKNKFNYVHTDHLTLNRSLNLRLVTLTTREQAIEDMRYLAQKTPFEEMWLEIPLGDKSMFFEIGTYSNVFETKNKNYKSTINWSKDQILELVKYSNTVNIWHYHPDTNLFMAEAKKRGIDATQKTKVYSDSHIIRKLFGNSLSGADLDGHIRISFLAKKDVTHYNVSSQGVVRYKAHSKNILALANAHRDLEFIGDEFELTSTQREKKLINDLLTIEYKLHDSLRNKKDDTARDSLLLRYAIK